MDYPFPAFASLGEQAVKKSEIAFSGDYGAVFGYIPQYSEMKFHTSKASGEFLGSLEHWAMARKFDTSNIRLNSSFLYIKPNDPAFTSIFAVQDGTDYCVLQQNIKMFVNRRLPRFGIPHL